MSELEQLLSALVNIPSPNPPGDCREIADYIVAWLEPTGAKIEVLHPAEKEGATSVVATLGDGQKPVVMLHAHIDTVPVAEDEAKHWSYPPFEATIQDGRLYGKGSIDDKGILAAMMMAFKKLAASSAPIEGTVVLVAAAEEEVGGQLGTRWLVDAGQLPEADFIVVGEQTGNRVALAHKGVMRAAVTTRGQSVHATNPDRGINAITAMARVVLALEAYHQALRERPHPLVGVPTCNVGTIEGGSTANAVPDACTVRLDRRMVPREDPDAVKRELQEVVSSVEVAPAEVEIGEFLFSSWFDVELRTELGHAFLEVAKERVGDKEQPTGYLPGSDAKHLLALMRGDMIIFGPGSYEVAHAFNEHVDLADLKQCEEILSQFLEQAMRAAQRALH